MKKHLKQLNIVPNTIVGGIVLLFALVTFSYKFERKVTQDGYPMAFVFRQMPKAWLSRLLHQIVPHWIGLTIGQIIFVNDVGSKWHERTIRHELVHIRQQANLGFLFFFTYTWSSMNNGYFGNKYEEEAYNATLNDAPEE